MLTEQQVFEKVAKHLFTQGQQAASANSDTCRYRIIVSGKKLTCAIGCMIPDENYDEQIEGIALDGLINPGYVDPDYVDRKGLDETYMSELFAAVPELKGHTNLLSNLQWAHDTVSNWINTSEMQKALGRAGGAYELDQSFLQELKFEDR